MWSSVGSERFYIGEPIKQPLTLTITHKKQGLLAWLGTFYLLKSLYYGVFQETVATKGLCLWRQFMETYWSVIGHCNAKHLAEVYAMVSFLCVNLLFSWMLCISNSPWSYFLSMPSLSEAWPWYVLFLEHAPPLFEARPWYVCVSQPVISTLPFVHIMD